MNKWSYGVHVSCCEQGCRQPSAGRGGLKWAATCWDWCEPSWQDGCVLGLRAGNHQFEAGLCLTFFTYVKKVEYRPYMKKVEHRAASNWWFPAHRPSTHPSHQDGSHQSQHVAAHFNPPRPADGCLQPCSQQFTCAPYDHLFILRCLSLYDYLFILI